MAEHDDLHDRGLAFDLTTILDRRQALKLFAGAGLATLIGCGSDDSGSSGSATSITTPSATSAAADCETIPGETAGPYPGDGSNGPNVLTESGIVRDDIRSSFGDSSGTAEGVPLTVELTVVDTVDDCAALAGAAVYVWHCDRAGGYSRYSDAQLATVEGDVEGGYTATLTIAV